MSMQEFFVKIISMKTNKIVEKYSMHIQLKIMNFYCTSSKTMPCHFAQRLKYTVCPENGMCHPILICTRSNRLQAPKESMIDPCSTLYGLVRSAVATKWTSGTTSEKNIRSNLVLTTWNLNLLRGT